jgi:2-polyprenyl-6-methoxyphenol hydroxylase-like FAD-dependent oxidoreductase
MIGIPDQPQQVGMGIWRTVAKRPPEMECSEMYYGGPKYKAGYTPISDDLCYAFLLEENLDRSFVGEGPNGALLKEHGQGYGGIWGQVRDSLADDAVVNYAWIEAICVESPWYRGRSIIIGDAAHACPPLIAQGAAMCAEDAVILAEMVTSGEALDDVLPKFMARRFPRVKMVLDNSLQLAEWEIHPDTPGADPGRIMGQTLQALVEPA